MPPASRERVDGSGTSGSQHTIPIDAEELHSRTRQFISVVGPTLDSIETLLGSWSSFRKASASLTEFPENSIFRSVHIDPFTLRHPPPSVSEAEITQYIKNLSEEDLRVLHEEYELTHVDDYQYVRAGGDKLETTAQVAARTVHFADETGTDTVNDGEADNNDGEKEESDFVMQPIPLSVSPTARAKMLFEDDGASVGRINVRPDGRLAEVRIPAASPATPPYSQTAPAFSLEPMPPSAVAAHERRRSSPSDSLNDDAYTRSSTPAFMHARESCTVEIEYNADHFIPFVAQHPQRDGASGAIMIKPGVHHTSKETTRVLAVGTKKAAPLQSDSDDEGGKSEAVDQSFVTFSRMVLAKEGCRLTSQRTLVEAQASAEKAHHVAGFIPESQSSTDPAYKAEKSSMTPPAAATAAATANLPASTVPAATAIDNTVSAKVMRNTDPACTCDAFVRCRVRDIILANRVSAADTAALGATSFAKLDAAWSAAANQTIPVLRKLDEILRESSALLHALEGMDHQAYRERVMDPTQYLCVPRYSVSCAALDCHNSFSTTTTRVMCGRCGQFFCPACCVGRGLGPDVVCDGQRYSLGWEPLCRICFQMCLDSQQKLVEKCGQHLQTENAAAYHDAQGGDGKEEVDRRAPVDSLTPKQAVLFGAYCDEQPCLGDGLPPFYVMDGRTYEGVTFWDILKYRFAKTQGSLRKGWQSAGNMATRVVQGAAQMMSKRRADSSR